MAIWFETKIRYDRMQEDGTVRKVNEPYYVDALTFTDAEARIVEKMTPFISGEFMVSAIKRTKVSEVFFDESDYADKWYMVKVNFITLDDKSGKEKKAPNLMLVQAGDTRSAQDHFNECMKDTMADYEIESVTETKIMDVFPHEAKTNA